MVAAFAHRTSVVEASVSADDVAECASGSDLLATEGNESEAGIVGVAWGSALVAAVS